MMASACILIILILIIILMASRIQGMARVVNYAGLVRGKHGGLLNWKMQECLQMK